MVPCFQWDLVCATLSGDVLAVDFHLEDFVGLFPVCGFGVCQKRDKASLKGAETTFDFAFGLRRGSDEVGHTKPSQGTLEFAFRIAVVVAGTRAKHAQAVSVDDFR